jgi:hypothetical protein
MSTSRQLSLDFSAGAEPFAMVSPIAVAPQPQTTPTVTLLKPPRTARRRTRTPEGQPADPTWACCWQLLESEERLADTLGHLIPRRAVVEQSTGPFR